MSMTTSAPSGASDLYDLVWFPRPEWCDDLAKVALPENWDDDASGRQPILFSYFRHYTKRIVEENLWQEAVSPSGRRISAFDTGLLSRHFEPIYTVFEQNNDPSRQPWVHKEWASPSSARLRDFDRASLQRAVFFQDPAEAVYDPRLEVVANLEHILEDNEDRFPAELQSNAYLRRAALDNAIQTAAAKARSNWRLAAPQFYWPQGQNAGRVQLLLPLALLDPARVDLALVIDRDPPYADHPEPVGACYRAYTVLPLDWAYRNARLITRPEAHWLDINTREAAGTLDTSDDDGTGTWRPARPNNSCPVCGDVSGCLVRADNRQVTCRNVQSSAPYTTRSGRTVWLHEPHWGSAVPE